MFLRRLFFAFILLLLTTVSHGQDGSIFGFVELGESHAASISVAIEQLSIGTTTDDDGYYVINNLPYGQHLVTFSILGFETRDTLITLSEQSMKIELNTSLSPLAYSLNDIVITGTKTFKRKTDSPTMVGVISSETMESVQACNLSEGLKFQPGLRVETDCQTCNYTQLRMNGLTGGYSQILINGRPIFSPLTGLYGLEQIPTNMIDRIEVIRGAGSTLYGSSAIGGTVNVMTRIPKVNSLEIGQTFQSIDGRSSDFITIANASMVSKSQKTGSTLFVNYRNRDFFDANGDDYSELPLLETFALGLNSFLLPTDHQKLEFNLSYVDEYRLGGEMIKDQPAHLAEQSEERQHHVWMGSIDYQINFNDENSSFITYAAFQHTDRNHYTGIRPDEQGELADYDANPPYGTSDVTTYNIGLQLNHKLSKLIWRPSILTVGLDYLYEDVYDVITPYNYLVDQKTKDLGVFVQNDWSLSKNISLLVGLRLDDHNLVDQPILSPRASLLYRFKDYTQFRLSYGSGFRAPQAIDTDLHIAFAGGGVSRVRLSPGLKEERSHSYSASINYDLPKEDFIYGFTLEGFYNRLLDAFVLESKGEDEFGETFVKENGSNATVQGLTLELRANYKRKWQLEAGLTIQSSKYDDAVSYIDDVEATTEFMRTPNQYGYAVLTYNPHPKYSAILNYVYTGPMYVPHFAGAPNQLMDEIIQSERFSDLSIKINYDLKLTKYKIALYAGLKNIFDSYQSDFDIGKYRDSNYIYGPAQGRAYYLGASFSL